MRRGAVTPPPGAIGGACRRRRRAVYAGPSRPVLNVTPRDGRGLLHGDEVPGLPRPHTALEPCLGAVRHRARRTPGRTRAAAPRVVRGAGRVRAGTAAAPLTPERWAPRAPDAWRAQHQRRACRQPARVLQRRFRRQPEAYLAALADRLVKRGLPP